jgi:hypothetical protein
MYRSLIDQLTWCRTATRIKPALTIRLMPQKDALITAPRIAEASRLTMVHRGTGA